MARNTRPAELSDVIAKVLKERGLGAQNTLAKLIPLWGAAVGEKVASHAAPTMLKGGLLTITVDGSAWMNQLSMLSQTIIAEVNTALGGEEVSELKFRLGKIEKAAGKKREDERPVKVRLTPEVKAGIEGSVAAIHDAEVREKARRLLIAASTRKR